MDPDLARIYRLSALQKERTRLTTMIEGCRGDNVQNKDGGETLTRSLERELANVDAELGGLEQEQFDYVRRARNQDSPAGPGGVLSRGQSMRSSVGFSSDVTLGGLVRGLGLGDWRGIKPEVRAMMSSGAAAAVPGYVTAGIVDAAREASVIFQAGAQVMAVDVPSAKVARVISEPGAEWLPESEERQLSDGAWVFDTGTLDACSAWLYTTLSVEAVEDCVDLDAAIQRSFAAQLALAFDQAALAGDGADMPLGIANMGTEDDRVIEVNDIGVLVDYRPFVRAMGAVKAAHHAPSSVLMPVEMWTALNCLQDGDLNPMRIPRAYSDLTEFVSGYLPIDGGAGNEQTAIVGDLSKLTVGVRTDVTIEVSRTSGEAFRKGAVAVRGYVRFGVYLTDPTAIAVMRGILPEYPYS